MIALQIITRLPALMVMLQALSGPQLSLLPQAMHFVAIVDQSSANGSSASEARSEELSAPNPANNTATLEPHVQVVNPAPAPQLWSWHDRVSWAATLILVAVGYWILFVLHRVLRRLDENNCFLQEAAHAAAECAEAARITARALSYQSRPWMAVSVEQMNDPESSFRIIATNRGQSPAELVSTSDRIGVVRSESFLPKVPEFVKEATTPPTETVIYPNGSIVLQTFKHDDLRWICSTQELFRSVQQGIDKVFIYGKVSYKEKASDVSVSPYETNWCFSYTVRGSRGALVPFGSSRYRQCL
jgi:hypothetical protein